MQRGSPSKDELVMGTHAVDELLKHAPEKLKQIFTTPNKKSSLLEQAKKKEIPISYISEKALTDMVGSDSHQSIVAHTKPRIYWDAKDWIRQEKDLDFVLMLDQIFDPQNFGALIRSAECLGVSAVIWSKNRGAALSPVAAKTSSGASEFLPLIRVSNLATTVDQFKDGGYEVVASLLNPDSESAFDFTYAPKTVLIVGSEGEGIQPLLQKKADRSIYIPMKGKIGSLNVAQATAVLLALRY